MIELERFAAFASDKGSQIIVIWADEIDASSHDDPHATIPGRPYALTEDGEPVERINDDTWRLPYGKILQRER